MRDNNFLSAIDEILDKVGQNVQKFLEKYVETNPFKLIEIEGSPSVLDITIQETPKVIVEKNLFPHKSTQI